MRSAFALLALGSLSCLAEQNFPGNEVMGTFAFAAEELSSDCQALSEVPDGGFRFSGTFSRTQGGSQAWFTLGGVSQEGIFDGQALVTVRSAARSFPECECSNTRVVETLRVALVSRSQNAALDGGCPERPLDGGVPAQDPDRGIFGPSSTDKGFDAIRACGELIDQVVPDPDAQPPCQCAPCTMRYTVRGDRR